MAKCAAFPIFIVFLANLSIYSDTAVAGSGGGEVSNQSEKQRAKKKQKRRTKRESDGDYQDEPFTIRSRPLKSNRTSANPIQIPPLTENEKQTQIEQLLDLALDLELESEQLNSAEVALRYFQEAAKLGSPEAEYHLARHYFRSGDWNSGLAWLSSSAQKGFVEAKVELVASGILIEWKMPAEKRNLEALMSRVKLLQVYAEAGNPSAQNHLGYLYQHGIVVPIDLNSAEHWYLKAQENGNLAASVNLECLRDFLATLIEGVVQPDELEKDFWEL